MMGLIKPQLHAKFDVAIASAVATILKRDPKILGTTPNPFSSG